MKRNKLFYGRPMIYKGHKVQAILQGTSRYAGELDFQLQIDGIPRQWSYSTAEKAIIHAKQLIDNNL